MKLNLQISHAFRTIQLLLVVIILMAIGVPQDARAATAEVVATPNLNLRSCPTLECNVVATAPLGSAVEVTGVAVNGFLPVRHNGTDGWAYRLFLQTSSTAPWFTEGSAACAPKVGLVFNIGIGYTPSQTILNTLISEGVAATMFPMGSFARNQPAYLRQLAAAGFPIGTHGDQNRLLTDVSDDMVRQDTLDSIAAIEAVIGRPLDELHTPYAADTDNRVRSIVSDLGLLPVGWTIAANDYAATATEQAVYSRIMNNVYPGAVIEFHLDGPATAQSTARALPRIIRDLRSQGYDFGTIPDMIKPCGATWPVTPLAQARVVADAGSLRCRTTPSTNGGVIITLPAGAQVSVRGPVFNGWLPVTCSSRNGWMSADYLVGSVPTPTPTITPTASATTTPVPGTTQAVISNTNGANLRCRATANSSGTIVTSLPPGTSVVVRGAAVNGWTPVRCAGVDGWMSSAYLRITTSPPVTTTPTATATTVPSGSTGTVVNTGGTTLRCRTGAGTGFAIITSLAAGSTVAVRGTSVNGWVPVSCGGRDGWVSADYLRINP